MGPLLFARSRKALMALLFAWHASMSLCGPGHHALSGLVERLMCAESSSPGTEEAPASNAHSHSDCPACHFFSQSFDSPPIGSAAFRALAVDEVRPTERAAVGEPVPSGATPRAPPSPEV